jgi:hypothetical protein
MSFRQWTCNRPSRRKLHEAAATWPRPTRKRRGIMVITFMTITCRQEVREALGFSRDWTKRQLAIAVAMCFVLGAGTALAGGDSGFCSRTAKAVFRACQNEVRDDFFIAKASCINESDDAERAQCFVDARASRREGKELCREQRTGRLDACKSLGEGRYDPDFDPALFETTSRTSRIRTATSRSRSATDGNTVAPSPSRWRS